MEILKTFVAKVQSVLNFTVFDDYNQQYHNIYRK